MLHCKPMQLSRSFAMRPHFDLAKQLVQHTVECVRLRLLHEIAVVLFNLREIGDKVSLMWLDPLGPLQ
jgi:hypothetical protein